MCGIHSLHYRAKLGREDIGKSVFQKLQKSLFINTSAMRIEKTGNS